MKDRHLIDKRLGFIVDCVDEIRRLAVPARLTTDLIQLRFVERSLQIAVQAMLDIAIVVCAERHLGEPSRNREVFRMLAGDGWIAVEQIDPCKKMIGFRNVVVHQYLDVDPEIVKAIVESHLDDLLAFVRSIRARLA